MAPDCEKFLRLRLASGHSHTFGSIFYFSCPVALVLAFTFHLLVRKPLLTHLPPVLYRRLGRFTHVDWVGYFRNYYWGVILSILIGAMLHLFWDIFTHPDPLANEFFPLLAQWVNFGGEQIQGFFLMGLLSSVVGGMVVIGAIWKMPVCQKGPVPTLAAVLRYWGIVLVVAAVLTVNWLLLVEPGMINGGISAISAFLVGIVVASVYSSYSTYKIATQ
ncbi:hypothetical protein A0257_11545 [Hymenobacter psoromatis]|nr:hypothetical protein A0257_11545 [Hymenobacter psoromatis]